MRVGRWAITWEVKKENTAGNKGGWRTYIYIYINVYKYINSGV
jgi:hypothetical protein